MIDRTLKNYIEDLSSNSPVPGGGSVGDIILSFSASLALMVYNFTKGLEMNVEELIRLRDEFYNLSYLDEESYRKVTLAYKLPKEKEEDKKIRKEKIEEALKEAALIPLKAIKLSKSLIPFLDLILKKGNKNLVSDIGVAVYCLETGAISCYYNVLINLNNIKDEVFNLNTRKEVEDIKNYILNWCSNAKKELFKLIG